MTVKELILGMMFIFCLMATGVILPIGVVAGSASLDHRSAESSSGPVFIFEEYR